MLEEIKEDLINKIAENSNGSWKDLATDGFDACMNLELPIKFAEYLVNKYPKEQLENIGLYNKLNMKEMFDYFLNNVYESKRIN